ncbi:MAG: tetratricopeptide repeat protein [Thermogemmata sp.]|nr:tetratricopeptide repeat protein [Thermogemmata sp.]
MTPWVINEYLLKGLYLGLWTFLALQVPTEATAHPWINIVWVVGWIGIGLLLAFALAALWQMIQGLRPWHNWLAFPLLVLLESPTFVYAGVVGGLVLGVVSGSEAFRDWTEPLVQWLGLSFEDIRHRTPDSRWLLYCAGGGLLLGFGFYRLRRTEDRRWRLWLGLILAAALAYLAVSFAQRLDFLRDPGTRWYLGIHLLVGIPFFYLLAFCGEAEESEVEIMALAATLGAALYLLGLGDKIPGAGATVLLLPLLLYYVYSVFLLTPLRVFKHVLRGYSYLKVGRLRIAVEFFRRALQLEPRSRLAQEGMLQVHRRLTPQLIAADAALAALVDYDLCLDRAAALLMQPPTAAQLQEAQAFLQLVEQKKPALQARVDYLRTLALLHQHRYEEAATLLHRLLDPAATGYHPGVRQQVLFDAWELALRLHPQMIERVGRVALHQPGRCMEAIAAVERRLRSQPQDPAARELKTWLYPHLQEQEFVAVVAPDGTPPADFDYAYVEQLGLALLDDPDPQRRERGRSYLRIAARGLPDQAVGLYVRLADSYDKEGDTDHAHAALEMARRAGQQFGPRRLSDDQRRLYLEALQRLARHAEEQQNYTTAIALYRQYLEDGGPAALETYRKLAELYGRLGDPLNAVLMVETGLTYDATDADLLRKKDTFYYSLDPQRLEQVRDKVAPWFDVDYCVRKATAVLNAKETSVELLDWATHLARLAVLMQPTSNAVRLVQARVLLRGGKRSEALQLLEDIHYDSDKGSGSEEEAWYAATRLLGQLYLDELGKPENALHCFLKYKEYYKSGADTLYHLARCYEALGDLPRAIQHYKAVTAFEGHPLVWEAEEAVRRLQQQQPS